MSLSKQNYEAIADILAKNRKLYNAMDLTPWGEDAEKTFRQGAAHALMKLETDLIEYFKNDNNLFSPTRFRAYIIERSRP